MKKERRKFSDKNIDSEIQKEVLELKRTSVTTKGGRRASFSSLTLIKNTNDNSIALGRAKGNEVLTALKKSVKKAKKSLVNYFPLNTRTIPYNMTVKFKATKIIMKPSPIGCGLKAGGIAKVIFKFLGIKDASIKIIGSNNKSNVSKAIFLGLDRFKKMRKNLEIIKSCLKNSNLKNSEKI